MPISSPILDVPNKGAASGQRSERFSSVAPTNTAATILIVDDEIRNRELLERLLQPEGYITLSAANAEEALASIADRVPDLILLDVIMPGMDGCQLAVKLKANPASANIPIIMVTAQVDRKARLAALNAGAEEFLTKPVDRAELSLRVRNLLRLKILRDLLLNQNLTLERRVAERSIELERSIDALRVSEARFRNLTEMSSDFYWESDAEHRLTARGAAQEKVSSVSNFQRGAQIGKRRWDMAYLSPDAAGWAAHRRGLDARQPFREFEFSRLGIDGTERHISISGESVFDASGAFTGFRGVGTDITKRKRAESKLRESEDCYRDLFENSQDLICTHDLDGKLKSVNPAAVRLTGFSREALLGMNMADLLTRGARVGFDGYLAEVRTKGVSRGLMRIRNAEGKTRLWEYNNTLRNDGVAAPLVRGRAQDVTERKRAQDALRQSEAQLSGIIESTADGILAVDSKGRVIRANRRFAELWRIPKLLLDAGDDQAMLDFVLSQLIDPEAFLSKVQALYATEAYDTDSLTFKDGRIFERSSAPLKLDGSVLGRVWSFRDVTEHRRRESELLRFRLAMDATTDAIYLVDRASMRFLDINAAACVMLGRTREAILAQGPEGVLSTPRAELERIYDAVIAGGAGTEPVAILRPRDDGTHAWIELRRRAQRSVEGWTIVTVARNIDERKRSEEALRVAEEQFRGLVEQSIAGIYIIQDNKLVYVNPRFAEIVGHGSAEELIGTDALFQTVEADRGKVLEYRRKLVNREAKSVVFDFRILRRDGITIHIGANVARATHRGRPAMIGMLQDISDKKRAEDEILRHVEELKSAFMSTVEVATIISEMRDPYTAGHERRVANLAVAMSAELGFDTHRQEGLQVAGHLHDIGKITIPSEILSKPGKLNNIEYQLIKEHAQASYDVLKGVKFPWPVAQVALQHHERFDGSGYPQGLKGEEILFEARIMAVADVVEAMSSHRPYRPGLGLDKALAEIERGRGSAYDPGVVDACLTVFRIKGYAIPE
jgi:PAS domain S-box-containing protein